MAREFPVDEAGQQIVGGNDEWKTASNSVRVGPHLAQPEREEGATLHVNDERTAIWRTTVLTLLKCCC